MNASRREAKGNSHLGEKWIVHFIHHCGHYKKDTSRHDDKST